MIRPRAAAAGIALLGAAACNAISGVGDLAFEPAGSGGAASGVSSASSSATASVGGAGGGGGAASTGTGGPPEDCLNGADDDGDGDADCADADCVAGGFACVPIVPGAEPVAVLDPGGACTAGYAPVSLFDCASCACSPDAASCTATVEVNEDQDCAGGFEIAQVVVGTTPVCQNTEPVEAGAGPVGLSGTITPTGASCVSTPPQARAACEPTAVGACPGAAGVCVPPGSVPRCVLVQGACPPPYDLLAGLVQSVDAPACGCSCTAAAQCPATVFAFSDVMCAGAPSENPLTGMCHDTDLASVQSLALPAATATCGPVSAPTVPTRSLCCSPGD